MIPGNCWIWVISCSVLVMDTLTTALSNISLPCTQYTSLYYWKQVVITVILLCFVSLCSLGIADKGPFCGKCIIFPSYLKLKTRLGPSGYQPWSWIIIMRHTCINKGLSLMGLIIWKGHVCLGWCRNYSVKTQIAILREHQQMDGKVKCKAEQE